MENTDKTMNKETEERGKSVWKDRKHHLWFPLSFTKYSVENGRLYTTKGFLSSREDECMLYRILDISVTRTLAQRLFGTGTIELNTRDRSNPVLLLENVKRPVKVKRLLSDEIDKERRARGVDGKDMYGASSHYDPIETEHLTDDDHDFEPDADLNDADPMDDRH